MFERNSGTGMLLRVCFESESGLDCGEVIKILDKTIISARIS